MLPALSAMFGIHPWDVDRLTFNELADYLRLVPVTEGEGDG